MLNWLRVLGSRIRGAFRRDDADFADELQLHLEMLAEENARRGMTPEAASHAARVRLGGISQLQEINHELRGLEAVERLASDIRYGLRELRKSPGFTAVAVLSLALGIGANTAIFSVINAVLLKSLPVQEPDRLVMLANPGSPSGGYYCYGVYRELRKRNQVFSGLLGQASRIGFLVTIDGGRVEKADGEEVSGNYFDVLGVKPYIGRMLSLDDERPPGNPAAVLSYGYWRDRFSGDAAVIGKSIRILDHPFTVVGV